MLERILGVMKLDVKTYEEIEHDPGALSQAAIIVVVVGILSGLGNVISATVLDTGASAGGGLISGVLYTVIGWVLWSAVTFFVGTRFFGGKADMGEMLRVIGFAFAPQVLGIVPCIGGLVGAIWTLVAGFIAVRQGLDIDNQKAAITIGVGLLAYIAVFVIVGVIFGTASAVLG